MSNGARSVYVFGVYLGIVGVALLGVPNVLLAVFSLPGTTEVWIRVVGMLALILGFYYTQAARKEMTDFFRWTIYTRSSVFLFFSLFVMMGLANRPLITFGVADLLGAVWTGLALRPARAR